MSGICGIVALDGGDVRPADLDAMLGPLEVRGPDGSHSWMSGPAGLGHTLLATTPEALVEQLPLTDPESGCTITADCRIDNRDELIRELGLTGTGKVIGDGELILRAYLRWGEECPVRLLGDFAFAIWDPRQKTLFCARDHMGMRQLNYCHLPGQVFVFATEPKALLSHAEVPQRINEGRIGDFLDDLEGIDLTSTFFEGIFRLPPAHVLHVAETGRMLRPYWQLDIPPRLTLASDDAYAEAFLDVFKEAIRCRLRSPGPVGAMLSGGLDSTSVAAMAAQLIGREAVHCFSAVGPNDGQCIETRSVNSALAHCRLAATRVDYTDLGPYGDELARAVEEIDDPFDAHMNLARAIYLAAHRQGLKIVLDGVGSDLAMTTGNRIGQLILGGRLRDAATEARDEARFWGSVSRPGGLLLRGAWAAMAPASVRRFKQAVQDWFRDGLAMAGLSSLTRNFAARVGLDARRRRYRRHLFGASAVDRRYQLLSITHPHTTAARERYDRIASRFAIEPRDPFLDIRVLSFCLSLPVEQLRGEGWTKLVLRRAMDGTLPADVAWRRGKDHLGLRFTESLIGASAQWQRRWLDEGARLQGRSALLPPKPADLPPQSQIDAKNFIELFALTCWLTRYDVRKARCKGDEYVSR